MTYRAAVMATLMLSTACWAEPNFDQMSTEANQLYQAKAYQQAAALLERMAADPALTGHSEWPDRLYDLARDYALAGQPDKALTALENAAALGALVTADDVAKEADFAAIAATPRFKAVIDTLNARARLWQDNPALATPYQPVLSEEEKAAGVSKIWAEARFNFAFFDRVPGLDWDGAYMAALQDARAAKTTEAYYAVLMRFGVLLMDGHTRVIAPPELMDRFYGITPVDTRLVDGKIIVTAVSDPALKAAGIVPGAEVVAIDGKPALAYAKTVGETVFGFTPQDRVTWQYGFQLLRGPVGQPVALTVKDAHGKTHIAALPRIHNTGAFGVLPPMPIPAEFRMLPGNVAYLKINWFVDDAGLKVLKENFAAASGAKGLIIDIRENSGGNDDYGHALAAILADKPFQGSTWRTREYRAAYRSWRRPEGWMRAPAPTFQPDATLHYAKPVVVLVGPRTYSAAEDFLMALSTTGRAKLVGETTGGSTGNPLWFKLPGGGSAFICTKDDNFANGRALEGVGIAPDVTVKPTIADIRAGRDPVLEKATAMLVH